MKSGFNDQRPRGHRGFSLIEVVAAMAIMSILLIILGSVFTVSQKAMSNGLTRSEKVASGRAAIDFMARELSQAVVDDTVNMALKSVINASDSNAPTPDALAFAAVVDHSVNDSRKRALKQIVYFVQKEYSNPKLKAGENQEDYKRSVLVRGGFVDQFGVF